MVFTIQAEMRHFSSARYDLWLGRGTACVRRVQGRKTGAVVAGCASCCGVVGGPLPGLCLRRLDERATARPPGRVADAQLRVAESPAEFVGGGGLEEEWDVLLTQAWRPQRQVTRWGATSQGWAGLARIGLATAEQWLVQPGRRKRLTGRHTKRAIMAHKARTRSTDLLQAGHQLVKRN